MDDRPDSDAPLFSARDQLHWRWQSGDRPDIQPPQAVILCHQPRLLRQAQRRYPLRRVKGFFGECFLMKRKPVRVALAGGFGIGSPAIAILVEEYAAFGVSRFLSVGLAGSLQPDLHPGDVVVCDSALRGEGTSFQYLPPADVALADPQMTQELCAALTGQGLQPFQGRSWTTDAPYRETRRQVTKYRREGVLCVEMEAAALFAVSHSLGEKAAAVFVVADQLSESGWEPPRNMELVQARQAAVLQAAISWLG